MPEVTIQNEDLSEEFYEILEDENLDDTQQAKLEKKFAQELEVIKRDDRLETIAKDIVYHFPRRGYLGKGLMIAVDKFTAVKMYDKTQRLWKEELRNLQGRISQSASDIEKARLKRSWNTCAPCKWRSSSAKRPAKRKSSRSRGWTSNRTAPG